MDRIIVSRPFKHENSSSSKNKSEKSEAQRFGFDLWVEKILWKREGLPTPVFLSGEFHGQRNLMGYSSWGQRESDMME